MQKFVENNTFFIVGHHGVGKTYTVNLLKSEEPNILHIDTGPLIRKVYYASNSSLDFQEWEKDGIKTFGENFSSIIIANEIVQYLEEDFNSNKLIITGNRSIIGIEYLIDVLNIKNPKVIFIDSIYSILKNNYESRENREVSDKEFILKIKEENEMGITKLKQYAIENTKFCKIINNYDNKSLLGQLKNAIEDLSVLNEKEINHGK